LPPPGRDSAGRDSERRTSGLAGRAQGCIRPAAGLYPGTEPVPPGLAQSACKPGTDPRTIRRVTATVPRRTPTRCAMMKIIGSAKVVNLTGPAAQSLRHDKPDETDFRVTVGLVARCHESESAVTESEFARHARARVTGSTVSHRDELARST
jgi:hypothetical protein